MTVTLRALGATLLALCVLLVPVGPATASNVTSLVEQPEPLPPAGEPWFGPQMDWLVDSAEDYRDRLGSDVSLYGQRVAYPLTDDSTFFLRRLATESAAQGAVPVLSIEPSVPLTELTVEDAEALVAELAALHETLGVRYLLRFANEMNGTWYTWGQQPTAYVEAFRELAEVVHDDLPVASMVWSPVYGAGYPYGAAYGDVDPDRVRDVDVLDTDGNERLDGGDDPYGPFWPGPDAVDWVGLTLYHFGPDRGRVDNELDDPVEGGETGDEETSTGFETDVAPREGAFRSRLNETYGYGGAGPASSFYERFAERFDKPMLVDTGAVWIPDPDGDPELEIKQTWWRQVLRTDDDFPLVRGILWVEERRREAEVRDRTVDWRATRTPELAEALLRDLQDEATLGPVTPPVEVELDPGAPDPGGPDPGAPVPGVDAPSPDHGLATAVQPVPTALGLAIGAGSLALLGLLAAAAWRWRPSWRWRAPAGVDAATWRDPRIDVARGGLLLVVVAAHVELLATTDGPVARLMGAVTGPEAFVLVAGLALGLRHEVLVDLAGGLGAASARWKRALALWASVVLSALVVLGLRYLPGTADHAVTRWLPGDGTTDLYADAAPLLEYPPPWWAVRELFVLHTIPWPLSMVGLLVVLALVAPVLLAVLRRGGWWLVLALSWGGYAAGLLLEPDWTRGTFEAAYPPLVWQVVFVHGLVLSHHRRDLGRLLERPWVRRVVVAALALGTLVWLALTTWAAVGGGEVADRLVELSGGRDLPAGRLVALGLTALVAWLLLTACWGPLSRALDPLLGPVGRAGTTVLVVHLLLLVGLAAVLDVADLDLAEGPVRAVATAVLVAVTLLAVRSRVLRAVVPG